MGLRMMDAHATMNAATMVALEQSSNALRVEDIKQHILDGKGNPLTSKMVRIIALRDNEWKVTPPAPMEEVLRNLTRLLPGDYVWDHPDLPDSVLR